MKLVGYSSDGLPVNAGVKNNAWGKSLRHKNCCYCERTVVLAEVTREHVIPKRVGGRYTQPCCLACNREKGGMLLDEYLLWLFNLLADLRAAGAGKKKRRPVCVKIKNVLFYLKLLYPGEWDFL